MTPVYNENSISSLSDIEHIRHRTSAYIPDTGTAGLITIVREILDNAVDELMLANNGHLQMMMFIDRIQNKYQIVVTDDGRGIPVGKLIDSFCIARTSGKFDSKSGYTASAGLFGIGSTVTVSLSSWFRAITLNQDVIGDATMLHNSIPNKVKTVRNRFNRTGTVVMFEPDTSIFTHDGFTEYIENYGNLIDILSQLSLFCKFDVKFYVFDYPLPDSFRTGSSLQVLEDIEKLSITYPYFDNQSFNRDQYIKSYFGVSQNWKWQHHLDGHNVENTLSVEGDIFVLLNNSNTNNNKLTFINTIAFNDNVSHHISLLHKFVKQRMAYHLVDKHVKNFFIDQYKLPFWLVLDVKYHNAQFSGFAKSSFKDVNFEQPYLQLLNKLLPIAVIDDLYSVIADNIISQYNRFSNSDFKPSTMKNLLSRLNRPDKFNNCSTTNRELAELFLVEGDSAKSDQDRDSTFQASYTLGGKPFNGLTTVNKLSDAVENIKKNAVFQDIIRILNITPKSNDISNLNFWKIFIMADADTHGYHITNIVIGNLYALWPDLINKGHVYITVPPLYSLSIKGGKPIYIKNVNELNATLAYHLYFRCLDITIKSDKFKHVLGREEFVTFTELVGKIGDELDRLSVEYMIPAVLLEQLSLMTNHLNLKRPNVELIQQYLGCDVRYISTGNLLIVSIGSDDIIIPLNQITELIYSRILPMYREFYYGKTKIFVTTKQTNAMKESPISIVQLNEIFKRLSSMFTIKRYKGLGSMPPVDRSANCMNPKTRRVHQITSIGDIKTVFDMLGTDSTERKKLIVE